MDNPTLKKAKRVFLLNLALVSLLACILLALQMQQPDEPAAPTPDAESLIEPEFSAIEQMNHAGQALGLSEDPRINHPYSDEQLTQQALAAIAKLSESRDEDEPTAEATQQQIEAYIEGYRSRYEDYYNAQAGFDAGYQQGLKVDPTKYYGLSKAALMKLLRHGRSKTPEKYPKDEAAWILYQRAYDKGYSKGYPITKEGITLDVIDSLTP